MTVAMSCVTSALCHEDIVPHISPLFTSIPELQCTDTSDPEGKTLSAEPNFPADNGIHLVAPKVPDDPNPPPITPKFTDQSDPVAPKFTDDLGSCPVDPNFIAEMDSLRDPATSGYILNVAPTELHSAVLMPAALGSPFYDISSQLSLNLLTQDLGFTLVQNPCEPFLFPLAHIICYPSWKKWTLSRSRGESHPQSVLLEPWPPKVDRPRQ